MELPQDVVNFRNALAESKLVSAPQLAVINRDPSLQSLTNATDLARLLIKRGLITSFQAARLLEGRSRGFLFDQYKITDVLGVGGMGCVYQAIDTQTGDQVALKVLLERLKEDQGLYARFVQEAELGLRMNHPNVLRTLKLGTAGGLPYVITEYVNGASLIEILIHHKRLPWQQACDFARQGALGLQHIHQAGIVHRDIKPQNILVDPTGRVRLLDFGLAMAVEGDTGSEFSMAMIFGHETVGTADYSAPEQSDDSLKVDGRADIYGLGVTLFVSMTGMPLFNAKSTMEMIQSHRVEVPRRVTDLQPKVPPEIADIIAKMLEKDPDDRYQTATEVAEALAPWSQSSSAEFQFQEMAAERKQEARRRLAQISQSRSSTAAGLNSSTARPSRASSVARARDAGEYQVDLPGRGQSLREAVEGAAPPPEPEPLAVLTWLNTSRTIPLMQERIVIGRRDECDLKVADGAISSRHCELSFDGTYWWLQDLGSLNGTTINGIEITREAVHPADSITIGNQQQFRLEYRLSPAALSSFPRKAASRGGGWSVWIWLGLLAGAAVAGALVWFLVVNVKS